MGVLKNDVGRPSNKTIMIRNIFKVILFLVIMAGVFAAGYYLNDNKNVENKSGNKDKNVTKNITTTTKTITTTAENPKKENDDNPKNEAEKVMFDIFGKDYKQDIEFLGYYKNDINIFNKDFYKTLVAIKKTDSSTKYNCLDIYKNASPGHDLDGNVIYDVGSRGYCLNVYEEEKVEKTYNDLFKTGKLLKNSMDNTPIVDIYSYDKNLKLYSITNDSSGDLSTHIVDIYKYKVEENKLFITIAYNHFEYDENNDGDNVTLKLKDGTEIKNYKYKYYDEKTFYGIKDDDLIKNYGSHMENIELEFEKINGDYKFVNLIKKD